MQYSLIRCIGRDDHNTSHPDMGKRIQQRQYSLIVFRQKTGLLRFPSHIDLQQHIHDFALLRGFLFQRPQQMLAVRRFDQIKKFHSLFCLIGLQMTDQVPLSRMSYLLLFFPGFLNPVLTDIPNTQRLYFRYHSSRMIFRDGNQTNLIAGLFPLSTSSQCRCNRFLHVMQIICQHKTNPLYKSIFLIFDFRI